MKLRRILALAGIIFLLGLYVTTLICAIIETPFTSQLLQASLFATIIIPVILYAAMLAAKSLKHNHDSDQEQH